jgi:putative transposase
MIISIPEGGSISNFMRDFKRITAREFYQSRVLKSGRLWQDRFDDVAIITKKVAQTKLNYIHQNPVRAGLVENAEDWKYSSARFYLFGEKRFIAVTGMEP